MGGGGGGGGGKEEVCSLFCSLIMNFFKSSG